ncbi:hypothetical protein QF025_004439 [Paraburkholderia graminis]|uniref:Uncharacterized protein n=1 Tax=Paraburkholderia graminis TaxID=60548 RepID=A0ABD5CKI4_9BURK|nr:hypothetical protein [Paraburkholderia graminis]
MKEPLAVALKRRLIEPELMPQCGDGLRRGGLAERLLRGVARQQPCHAEHDGRHQQQREQREAEARGDESLRVCFH